MKIKRFFATDIRQALNQVREALGPDAVILSNKKVDGGIELVAARDYDESVYQQKKPQPQIPRPSTRLGPTTSSGMQQETKARASVSSIKNETAELDRKEQRKATTPRIEWSQDPVLVEMREEMKQLRRMMENELSGLSWHEMGRQRPHLKELLRRLITLDLSHDICHKLVDRVADVDELDQAWRKALYFLSSELLVEGDTLLEQGGIVALVGPTGVGKTTTIAKLSARYALRHGNRHVALISTDNYRIGAQEQLNTYARILDVPIRSAANAEELHAALNSFADKRLVLIDTAGMSQRDIRLGEQLALLQPESGRIRTYLTLSATTQQSALEHAIRAFNSARPEACLLTKVDEAATLGGAVSALIRSGLPLAFITDGQKVPEDIHIARSHTLISKAATLGEYEGEEYGDDYLALALGGATTHAHL